MSETQDYKKDSEFTLPVACLGLTRSLFEQRLKTVNEVLGDPEALRVLYSRNEMANMAFESLELAKMLRRMPEEPNA